MTILESHLLLIWHESRPLTGFWSEVGAICPSPLLPAPAELLKKLNHSDPLCWFALVPSLPSIFN